MRCNGCRARSCINAFVVLRTAEQAVSWHFGGAHSVKSQHSRGLQPRRASCRKNRTGTRAGARMPTIGSKAVPLTRRRGRERGVLREPQGVPQALGCSGSAWGRSRSFRATPRDRYTSVTTVTAVSRVVSQKSNFQRGRPSVLCAVGLGAAPRTTFAAGPWGLPRYNTDFTLPYLL